MPGNTYKMHRFAVRKFLLKIKQKILECTCVCDRGNPKYWNVYVVER